MNWKPLIDPGDKRIIDLLTDHEVKRIKQLESKFISTASNRMELKIEKEILDIYLDAIERNKSRKRLGDWLNQEEIIAIQGLKDELTQSDRPFYYEGMIYQVYLESICRQTDFIHEEEVKEYIDLVKKGETNEEVESSVKKLTDLLRTAGK